MRTCDMDGCDKRHKAKGLCSTHHMRYLIHGDPNFANHKHGVRGIATCLAEGCEDKALTKGFCNTHYLRNKKHGDPETVLVKMDKRSAYERWKDRYIVDDPSGCWVWTARTSEGYSTISDSGFERKAYKLAYQELVGSVPENLVLDHMCHNRDLLCSGGESCHHRRCINPAHLEAVPLEVNIARGHGVGARNTRKTRCKYGHDFDAENTRISANGSRGCRSCERRRASKSTQKGQELCSM